mmetsp:Transcript_27304/g.49614  ORF Transcript_27304/g.49614 Transcript_27304/m.49614 type:complete len:90 (+) Transcript_27304:1925-2194(+)
MRAAAVVINVVDVAIIRGRRHGGKCGDTTNAQGQYQEKRGCSSRHETTPPRTGIADPMEMYKRQCSSFLCFTGDYGPGHASSCVILLSG